MIRRSAAATAVALLAFPAAAVAADDPTDDYAEPGVDVSISVDSCDGGPVDFTGEASVPGDWSVAFDGLTRTGSGESFSTTFPVDYGTAATRTADGTVLDLAPVAVGLAQIAPGESGTLVATFDYGDGTVQRTAEVSIPVCDEDEDDGALGGLLPDTGGTALWLVVAGGVLVVGGAGAYAMSRRRRL